MSARASVACSRLPAIVSVRLSVATDNIDMLRDWTKKKFSGMEDQVDNFFHEVRTIL